MSGGLTTFGASAALDVAGSTIFGARGDFGASTDVIGEAIAFVEHGAIVANVITGSSGPGSRDAFSASSKVYFRAELLGHLEGTPLYPCL